jgi:hypothetical protein
VRDPQSASREELLELIGPLPAKVEALEARVAALGWENEQLRKGGGKAVPA